MRKYRTKKEKNKILLIVTIVLLILASSIIGIIIYMSVRNKKEEIQYEDKIVAQNYFTEITIDLTEKKVKRDENETTLQNEFGISEEEENQIMSSSQEVLNYFNDSVYDVTIRDNIAYIQNQYQTKNLLIQADKIEEDCKASNVSTVQNGLYILQFDTQKRTKEAYEYLKNLEWVKKIETDEVLHIKQINDESQTVYNENDNQQNKSKYKTHGVEALGLDNYQNIINQNGNPSDIVIATIGYGACIDNEYFNGRISDKYYNAIDNSKNVHETIPQGSRILEVIKESTTNNVKILPLVVVNDEGYSTISAIVKSIVYATRNADVICYELIHEENDMINLALENAYKENVPISCTTIAGSSKSEETNYPANSKNTFAISSIDKNTKIATYSGKGDYIDFAIYSTDVEEIFDTNLGVSKWSGPQYANAHFASLIALIKTYNKDYTISNIYDNLRKYAKDLGEKGKDNLYGYGRPDYTKISITDIDKTPPEIKEIKYDNEKWESQKKIQIIGLDNIRIFGWAITKTQEKPQEWNAIDGKQPTLDVTSDITENNKYYIWLEDSAENISYMQIEINKIDTAEPTIAYEVDESTLQTEKYVTIKVTGEDKDSGLNETPYSWDKENWGTESNILKVTENGRYKVYVRDAIGNIAEKEIKIDLFAREGTATINKGKIIKSVVVSSSWRGDTNDSVRITFKPNLNMVGWNITTSEETPDTFTEVEPDEEEESQNTTEENNIEENITENDIDNTTSDNEETNNELRGYNSTLTVTKSLKTGVTYYAWVKDVNGDIIYQTFSISKVEI